MNQKLFFKSFSCNIEKLCGEDRYDFSHINSQYKKNYVLVFSMTSKMTEEFSSMELLVWIKKVSNLKQIKEVFTVGLGFISLIACFEVFEEEEYFPSIDLIRSASRLLYILIEMVDSEMKLKFKLK